MSIKHDIGLIEKYRELKDVGSMKVTISQSQVCEIVVADLIAKYKACWNRGDAFEDGFAQVLQFYLTADEFNEINGTNEVFQSEPACDDVDFILNLQQRIVELNIDLSRHKEAICNYMSMGVCGEDNELVDMFLETHLHDTPIEKDLAS